LAAACVVWLATVASAQPVVDVNDKASAIASLQNIAMMLGHVGQQEYSPKLMNIAGRAIEGDLTSADTAALREIGAQLKSKSASLKATDAGKASLLATASDSIAQAAAVLKPSAPASAPATAAAASAPAPVATPVATLPAAAPPPPAVPAPATPPELVPPAATPPAAPIAEPVAPPVAAPPTPVKEMTFRLAYSVVQPKPLPPGVARPPAASPPRPMPPPQKQLVITLESANFPSVSALTVHLDKAMDKAAPTAAVVAASGEVPFADLQTVVTALARYNFVSIRVDNLPLRQAPPPAPAAPAAPVNAPAAGGTLAPMAPTPALSPAPAPAAQPVNPDNHPPQAWSTSAPDAGRILRRLRF
jgi:hypothetical protein